MSNILEKIVADKRVEVAQRRVVRTIAQLSKEGNFERKTLSLKNALRQPSSGIIAEFKRKSPSKGWIHADADALSVTSGYCANGASGISVLTDYSYFGGTPDDLLAARPRVSCPILRKDFTVDEYQLYEAKALGADLVLLIAAALSVEQTKVLARTAHELDLEVLLEVHSEDELAHANEFVDMLGVNNRNLKTFTTDVQISFDLADKIPTDFVKVSESGISQPQTVLELRKAGFQGFLMGENFMKEHNPVQALNNFIQQIK